MWFNLPDSEETRWLEEKLKRCSDISLSEENKARMKQRIMRAVTEVSPKETFGFANLVEKIKHIAGELKPAPYFSLLLKERLRMLAEMRQTSFFERLLPRGGVTRKVFAAALAVVFVFTALFNYTFKIERVEASVVTAFEEVSGEVFVLRDGQEIIAQKGFLLKADDTVKTGPGSKAVIRFLDQSVSRLDENTEVRIAKLFINPLNKTETVIELVLDHGRMWSRVISLIDDFSRFQVKTKNTVAVAKKKAAFDVAVSPKGQATVSAQHNRVDILVATNTKVVETTLVRGFTAEVQANTPAAPVIRPEQIPAENDVWIATNLAEDKTYIETVKQEAGAQLQKQVKAPPGSPLYGVKEFSESTKIAFTFDEVERQKNIIATAREKLAEAQVLLVRDGNVKEADRLLNEFKLQVERVVEWSKGQEVNNPIAAANVRTYVKEVLDGYQKQFALILPTERIYPIKDAIAQIQVVVAPGAVEKTQQKLSQAGDKLLEAHDLAEQGNESGAAEQVDAYSKAMAEVVSEVKDLPVDKKEKAVTAILDSKVEDLKSLQAIGAATPQQLPKTPAQASSLEIPPLPLIGSSTDLESTFLLQGSSSALLLPSGTSTELNRLNMPSQTVTSFEAGTSSANGALQLKTSITEAKTETLTKIGEAVFELQKDQPSVEVLKKLEDVNNSGVNGKPLVDVQIGKNQVLIKTSGETISVVPQRPAAPTATQPPAPLPSSANTPLLTPTIGSGTPVSPRTLP